MLERDRYFLECHIPGNDLPHVRTYVSEDPQAEKHLHITITRPFTIPEGNEEVVKRIIIEYCRGKKAMPYVLEGKDKFSKSEHYIPVESLSLEDFNSGLEKELDGRVDFDSKLGEEKILHMTIDENIDALPRTEMVMLRLICMKHGVFEGKKVKTIDFSFDFVTQEVLTREETLDKERWDMTIQKFIGESQTR